MNDVAELNDFIQASRLLRIETPLGADAFLMEAFAGREMVNDLFAFEAVVRAKREDVRAEELIGKTVDVTLDLGGGARRGWNALVTGLVEEPRLTRALRQYVLTLRPSLWLLSQRSDCRIWQNRTSVEVAETLLGEHGLPGPDVRGVVGTPPPQEYSIQWNETDLAYLLRRLEEDGLFYWIRQEGGAQTMVLADGPSGWDPGADGGEGAVRYAGGSTDRNHVTEWRRRFAFVPGRRTGRDWNFETPSQVPEGGTPSLVSLPGNAARELYEYPARVLDAAAAERATKLRMQAVEADHERIHAASTVRELAPGAKLKPYDVAHPENVFETAVVTAIEHAAQDTTYETGSGEPAYSNRFEAMPARLPATPHRATTRPRLDGTQIAVIAGPPGEEIHTDEYGRVKLWFPWDRRAQKDGSDTRWVRVVQPWAGGTWGAQVIPRIGMEAVVSYEGGDPDRPLVVGLVPNPERAVPYALPANKTRMVLRSDTHKGTGFNEVSFEDEAGRENMFFHAQKDQTTRVLNDRTKRVDRHEVASVGGNRALEVAANQKTEVGGSMNLTVGGTGATAMGLMTQVAGLAGQTAGLLAQAGAIAGGGGASLAAFAGTLATSALGFLGGGGLSAREGVVAGPSPRADAGTALAGAGTGIGDAASGLFPLPGIMNTVVGSFQSTTVGVAKVDQIGMSRVTNVGQTSVESIGKTSKLTVGERYEIGVGEVIFSTTKKHIMATSEKIILAAPGGVIEINEQGISIRGRKVEIKGEKISLLKGSDGCKASSPFMKE